MRGGIAQGGMPHSDHYLIQAIRVDSEAAIRGYLLSCLSQLSSLVCCGEVL